MTKPIARIAGAQFENSPEDKAKDRRMAKVRGMSVEEFEGSPADERSDRALKKRMGSQKSG